MADFRVGASIVVNVQQDPFKEFLRNIRQLRLDFLGLEQAALVLGRVGKALTGVGHALAGAFMSSIAPAAEYDDAMTRIQAVTGKANKQIRMLSNDFLEMSSTLPLSAQQLAEAGVEIVRAGVSSQEAIKGIALASGKLAAVADDLNEAAAAKGIVAISAQFGIATENMSANAMKLGDALTALKDAGIGTAGMIVTATLKFGAMARSMGVTQEQALALSAAVLKMGIPADVTGTALSQMFTLMSAKTAQFSQAAGLSEAEFRKLIDSGQGMAATQLFLNGITRNGASTATELSERLSTLGIRGQKTRSTMLVLAQNMGVLNDVLGVANKSTDALERQYQKFATSFEQQIKTFRGAVENLGISFGSVLKPIIVAAIQALLPLIDLLVKIPAPMKLAIIATVTLAGVLLLVVGGLVTFATMLLTSAASLAFLVNVYRDFLKSSLEASAATVVQTKTVVNLSAANVANTATTRARSAATETLTFDVVNLSAANSAATASTTALTRASNPLVHSTTGMLARFKELPSTLLASAGGFAGLKAAFLAGGLALIKITALVVVVLLVFAALQEQIEDAASAFLGMLKPIAALVVGLAGLFGSFDPSGKNSITSAILFFIRLALFPIVSMLEDMTTIFRIVGAILEGFVEAVLAGVSGFAPIFDRLRLAFSNIIDDFSAIGERLGLVSKEGSLFQSILNGIKTVVVLLLKPFTWFIQLLVFLAEFAVAAFVGVAEGIFRAFAPVIVTFVEIRDMVAKTFEEITKAFAPIREVFAELAEQIFGSTEALDTMGIIAQAVSTIVRFFLAPFVLFFRVFAVVLKIATAAFTGFAKLIIPVLKAAHMLLLPIIKAWGLWNKLTGDQEKDTRSFSDRMLFALEAIGDVAEGLFLPIVSFFEDTVKLTELMFGALEHVVFGTLLAPLLAFFSTLTDGLNLLIAGLNKLPGVEITPVQMPSFDTSTGVPQTGVVRTGAAQTGVPSFDTGGHVARTGVAIVHKGETIGKPGQLQVARKNPLSPANMTAPPITPAPSPAPEVSGGGGNVSISLSIPVKVMLNDLVLGETMVNVSEDAIRRAFGTRGVRLAGIG